jgi:hypothetical protein
VSESYHQIFEEMERQANYVKDLDKSKVHGWRACQFNDEGVVDDEMVYGGYWARERFQSRVDGTAYRRNILNTFFFIPTRNLAFFTHQVFKYPPRRVGLEYYVDNCLMREARGYIQHRLAQTHEALYCVCACRGLFEDTTPQATPEASNREVTDPPEAACEVNNPEVIDLTLDSD